MSSPQPAIFENTRQHHYALEYVIPREISVAAVKKALTKAIDEGQALCGLVLAIGPSLWQRLSPDNAPKRFAPLSPITGIDGHYMPATKADLLFWFQSDNIDIVFDVLQAIQRHMQSVAELVLDQPGFMYKDSRDLTGFVDGSANPEGTEARLAALVPDGEPFAAGAYVFSQKWVHNLDSFSQLAVSEQEAIVGRTKEDSIELEGDAMPKTSHVSRTDVKIDGVAQKIWRTSFPFGNASECGLYFLCFACAPSRVQIQLDRMFGVSGDGLHDHLIHHTKPVTGSYWFAPSQEDLVKLLEG